MSGTPMPRRAVLLGFLLLPVTAEAVDQQSFDAVLHDGAAEKTVGQVALDRLAHLELLSVAPDRADWLRRVASEANAADVMHADAPPRPGSPPFTDASRIIKRGEPEFTPALRDYLRAYYGLELRPR